jgi:nitrite reductase/ring-hydroxylating ferredoxin subunit
MAGGVPQVPGGGPVLKHVSGEPVLFVRLGERFYAYRPACPGCEGSLEDATLDGAQLSCPACGHGYDVRHAGRCDAAPDLHLEPVPLLVDDDGLVRVALGSGASG